MKRLMSNSGLEELASFIETDLLGDRSRSRSPARKVRSPKRSKGSVNYNENANRLSTDAKKDSRIGREVLSKLKHI